MKIICAPDSFKETLSAREVAHAMARGIRAANPHIVIDICPIGDGGEGTMDALAAAMQGKIHHARVTGPLGEPVDAQYAICRDQKLAIVELAQASGFALVSLTQRDPTRTTTFGTGELLRLAASHLESSQNATIILCIGSSATVDGGTGIAQALGAQFFDEHDRPIEQPMTGGLLKRIARWQPSPLRNLPRIRAACDVISPLCGPNGAAAIYGPQKGATQSQIRELDDGLGHLAKIVGGDPNMPGAGAAGGAGFGLVNICRATLERGIDLVLETVDFDARCRDADLVITGEGRLDRQSLFGKACWGVANAARKHYLPTIAIVGDAGDSASSCLDNNGGFLQCYISLTEQYGRERSFNNGAELIEQITQEFCRTK